MKKILKKILPSRLFAFLAKTKARLKKQLFFEKKVSYGTMYPDKTFFIIRRAQGAGLLSDFNYVLGHIIYADKKGWIPVVDMENCRF